MKDNAERWIVIEPNLVLHRDDIVGAYGKEPGENTEHGAPETVIKMRSTHEYWTSKSFAEITRLVVGDDPQGTWIGSTTLLMRVDDIIACMRRHEGVNTENGEPEVVIQMRNGQSFWTSGDFAPIVEALTGAPMPNGN